MRQPNWQSFEIFPPSIRRFARIRIKPPASHKSLRHRKAVIFSLNGSRIDLSHAHIAASSQVFSNMAASYIASIQVNRLPRNPGHPRNGSLLETVRTSRGSHGRRRPQQFRR